MPVSWIQRPALASDAAHIAAHRHFSAQATQSDIETYAVWVATAIDKGNYFGLLAEADGEVIAGAGVTLLDWGPTRDDPSPWRGRLVNVYTRPAYRSNGISSALCEALLAQA